MLTVVGEKAKSLITTIVEPNASGGSVMPHASAFAAVSVDRSEKHDANTPAEVVRTNSVNAAARVVRVDIRNPPPIMAP